MAAASLAQPGPGASGARLQQYELLFQAPEPDSARANNFPKGALWSADGSLVLAAHDDSTIRLYAPSASSGASEDDGRKLDSGGQDVQEVLPYAQVQEGGPIVDMCFFPAFSREEPASCCFLSCGQEQPIHLRGAADGSLWASYRPELRGEMSFASSFCFSADGQKIVAGFPQYLRIFDVQRPGKQVEEWTLTTRKGVGQKGIISAVAAASDSPGTYAAGSYNRNICVYHESTRGKPLAWLLDEPTPQHEMGGVTHLAWANENMLLSGHRKDRWIRVWDVRMADTERPARASRQSASKALLTRIPRSAMTHQRFYFSLADGLLATGDDCGSIHFYNLSNFQQAGCIEDGHSRPCVAAMLNPCSSQMLVTAAGSRFFPNYDIESEESDAEQVAQSPPKRPRQANSVRRGLNHYGPPGGVRDGRHDNTIRVWQLEWGKS